MGWGPRVPHSQWAAGSCVLVAGTRPRLGSAKRYFFERNLCRRQHARDWTDAPARTRPPHALAAGRSTGPHEASACLSAHSQACIPRLRLHNGDHRGRGPCCSWPSYRARALTPRKVTLSDFKSSLQARGRRKRAGTRFLSAFRRPRVRSLPPAGRPRSAAFCSTSATARKPCAPKPPGPSWRAVVVPNRLRCRGVLS